MSSHPHVAGTGGFYGRALSLGGSPWQTDDFRDCRALDIEWLAMPVVTDQGKKRSLSPVSLFQR